MIFCSCLFLVFVFFSALFSENQGHPEKVTTTTSTPTIIVGFGKIDVLWRSFFHQRVEWLTKEMVDELPWCEHASAAVGCTPKEWSNERPMLLLLFVLLLEYLWCYVLSTVVWAWMKGRLRGCSEWLLLSCSRFLHGEWFRAKDVVYPTLPPLLAH